MFAFHPDPAWFSGYWYNDPKPPETRQTRFDWPAWLATIDLPRGEAWHGPALP